MRFEAENAGWTACSFRLGREIRGRTKRARAPSPKTPVLTRNGKRNASLSRPKPTRPPQNFVDHDRFLDGARIPQQRRDIANTRSGHVLLRGK